VRSKSAPIIATVLLKSALVCIVFPTLSACSGLSVGHSEFEGRFYGGVGAALSRLEPMAVEGTGVEVDQNQSGGGVVQIGYDLSPRFSVESHYAALGEASFSPSGSVDYEVGGISALGYLLGGESQRTRRESFNLFARVGAGVLENTATEIPFERLNDFHLLAGLGAEYGFSNGFGLRLEVTSHDEDVLFGQLGLVYRIGKARRAPIEDLTADNTVLALPLVKPLGYDRDSDRDNILDRDDLCNDTLSGVPVKDNGCDYFDGPVEGVDFGPKSDVLSLETRSVLGRLVDVLKRHPNVRIIVAAHTDNLGPATENLMLSKYRVLAVTRFFVDQGIAPSRIRPQAYGETKPLYSNATERGRAINQRVEMYAIPQ